MEHPRRHFLKRGLALGAAWASGHALHAQEPATSSVPPQSKVAIARDQELRRDRGEPEEAKVLSLVDRAVQALYDRDNAQEAWKMVVQPGEVVGLKVNCIAGRGISTHVVLSRAICERLQQAGIKAQDILIWDQSNPQLEKGGYRIAERGPGVRCLGNDALGLENELSTFGGAGSLLSRAVTRICDVIINLPVLKDHSMTGVTIALKNMFGAIHNPNKYHLHNGDPYVADVYMLPPIRRKVRLTICDALTGLYEGGPSFLPQWTWPYNGLLVSRDPVALDYLGWKIIEKKRAEAGMKSLKEDGREPTYIRTAADAQHQIGTCDPTRIRVVRV